ncbi:hypothetical protein QTP88_007056 [Uroleucon formosanum]
MEISEAKNPEQSWCTYEIKVLGGNKAYKSGIGRLLLGWLVLMHRFKGRHEYVGQRVVGGFVKRLCISQH